MPPVRLDMSIARCVGRRGHAQRFIGREFGSISLIGRILKSVCSPAPAARVIPYTTDRIYQSSNPKGVA